MRLSLLTHFPSGTRAFFLRPVRKILSNMKPVCEEKVVGDLCPLLEGYPNNLMLPSHKEMHLHTQVVMTLYKDVLHDVT